MEQNHICKKCGGIAGWDSYFQSWICTRCGNEEPKPITNADKIRSMTNEQLADWLYREACVAKWCGANPNLTPGSKECDEADCMECIVMWLEKEGE